MPKKSRKSRAKYKAQRKLKPLAAREAVRHPESLPVLSKQMPAAKPPMTVAEATTRYRYVIPELRRIGIIAGAMFLLLVVLSFFLR